MLRQSVRLALVVIAGFVAAPGLAAEFKLGSPPVAVIDIPDTWQPNETDTGIEANSDDGDIYVGVEVTAIGADGKDLPAAMLAAFEWVVGQGAELDPPATPTEGKFNGWTGLRSETKGKDAEGRPTAVEVIGVPVNATTALIFTGWYVPGSEQKNAETLGKILQSIQPAK